MPKASDYAPEDRIIAMFVSESGDGKSAAAASFTKPFFQADFDGRFDGIWASLKENGGFLDGGDQIEFERFYPSKGIDPFTDWLRTAKQQANAKSFRFKTVELASITKFVTAITRTGLDKMGGHDIVGPITLTGPRDYKLEVAAINLIYEDLMELKCNIIFSAHLCDKWGKPKPVYDTRGVQLNAYAPNEIQGEKILMRDQIGEAFKTGFSNIFKFDREVVSNEMHYFVEFADDNIAKNAFGFPPGQFDITNQPFFPFLQDLIQKKRNKVDLRTLQRNKGQSSLISSGR